MGTVTRQLLALCRKNLWLKRNRWLMTSLELLLASLWIIGASLLTSHLLSQVRPAQDDPQWTPLPPVTNTSNWIECSSSSSSSSSSSASSCVLAISPNTTEIQMSLIPLLMSTLLQTSSATSSSFSSSPSSTPPLRPMFFSSEEELLTYYQNNPGQVWNALVFGEDLFNITIRTNVTYLPQSSEENTKRKFNPFSFLNPNIGNSDHYLSSGVIVLQQAVALALLNYTYGNSSFQAPKVRLSVKQLPFPELNIGSPSVILVFISPLVLLAFLPSFLVSLVEMVSEKQAKTKEYMKMMGLSESVYVLSWIIVVTVPLVLLTLLFVITNYIVGVFHHSDILFLLLFFLLFIFSTVAFSFLSASLCDSTRTCILTGGMWLYVVNSFCLFVPSLSLPWQYGLCLLAPMNFSLGFFLVVTSEFNGDGVHFGNDMVLGLSFGNLTWMMLLDTVIYSLLAWYIQNVRPGDWGVPKPFSFPFSTSYWRSVFQSPTKREEEQQEQEGYIKLTSQSIINEQEEKFPNFGSRVRTEVNQVESVRIQNLTKQFDGVKRPAVKDLNLSLYKGEIHVLLGHNGAGKSTTFGLLTGLFSPTSGGAIIEGLRLPEEMDKIRGILGVCPQQDILWEQLSALEHLRFFSHLKGRSGSKQEGRREDLKKEREDGLREKKELEEEEEIDKEGKDGGEEEIERSIESLLTRVGLDRNHWNKAAGGYSGGMKRKLSLAIALIGDSRVILLDEPTTGMDPVSRRHLYSFLDQEKKRKEGRVIILTTHNMEEAEVLGDKISIMSKGTLKCSGSSVFLKNKFGLGYFFLKVQKKTLPRQEEEGQEGQEVQEGKMKEEQKGHSVSDDIDILSLVKKHIVGSSTRFETSEEMEILLPSSDTNKFPAVFEELETLLGEKRIIDFSVSMNTLEDVFLKIASEGSEEGEGELPNHTVVHVKTSSNSETNEGEDTEEQEEEAPTHTIIPVKTSSTPLLLHGRDFVSRRYIIQKQLVPLLQRRFLTVLRNRSLLLFMILAPILSIFLTSLSFHYTEYLVNQGVNYDDILVPTVKDLNITSLPVVDLTNRSATDLIMNLENLTDPSLLVMEPTVASLEHYVLSNYDTSVISGGYIFDFDHLSQVSNASSEKWGQSFNITVFYNTSVSISLPVFFAEMQNAILRELSPTNTSFSFHLHPLPGNSPAVTFSSLCISVFISLSLLLSSFGRDIVVEREGDMKWQMLLGSMDILAYWISNFLADFLLYLFPVIISWIMLKLSRDDVFLGEAFPALILLTVFFTVPALLSQYVLSYLFKKPDNVLVMLHLINLLSGFLPYVLYFIFTSLGSTELANYLCLPFPTGTLLFGLQDLQNLGSVPNPDYWSWDNNIPKRVLFFFIQTIVFLLLLSLMEARSLKTFSDSSNRPGILEEGEEVEREGEQNITKEKENRDPEVELEHKRVKTGNCSDPVVLEQVYKSYSNSSSPVVNGISLGIRKGECFGYLGPNGAGKSTSIGMATGRFSPSRGRVLLEGNSTGNLSQQELYSRVRMGVCLQSDSLFEHLTGREHLRLFIRLRPESFHLTPKQIEKRVNNWINDLKISSVDADREVGTYSGGNKRKICVALAMLEKNRLVFLDEPSSGMDPDARRALWKVISKRAKARSSSSSPSSSSSSTVLTTHSMEEAGVVCDRIGIVVSGKLRCLGTTQQLKSRFGFGYRLHLKYSERGEGEGEGEKEGEAQLQLQDGIEVKVQRSRRQEGLDDFIKKAFPNSSLLESLAGNRTYELGRIPFLSTAFRDLQEMKRMFGIREFVITQNSLEQVFMHFAKEQDINSSYS